MRPGVRKGRLCGSLSLFCSATASRDFWTCKGLRTKTSYIPGRPSRRRVSPVHMRAGISHVREIDRPFLLLGRVTDFSVLTLVDECSYRRKTPFCWNNDVQFLGEFRNIILKRVGGVRRRSVEVCIQPSYPSKKSPGSLLVLFEVQPGLFVGLKRWLVRAFLARN